MYLKYFIFLIMYEPSTANIINAQEVPMPKKVIINAPKYHELEGIVPITAPIDSPHGKKPRKTPYKKELLGLYVFSLLTIESLDKKVLKLKKYNIAKTRSIEPPRIAENFCIFKK